MLIDTHCHLDFPEFNEDREEVLRRAQSAGVKTIINIGSSLAGSRNCLDLAHKYDCVYATVGIHPHEADTFESGQIGLLKELSLDPKVVGIGEIGLDYYKNYSTVQNQKTMFVSLVRLAREVHKPLVIHNRQANDDVLAVLKDGSPLKGVIHCFSGDDKFMDECLELGFFISFTCNITYKKAEDLRQLVKRVPLERLLLETDAPYLPPQELRGRRNEPFYVQHLACQIGALRGEDPKKIAQATTLNAVKLFNL